MFTIAPTHTAARTTVARPTTARRSSRKSSAIVVARASNASTDGVTSMDRRAVMRGAALALASGLVAAPREAMAFGFGGGESREEKYTKETQAIIAQVKSTLELAPGAEGREESINTTRQMTNAWVAKYRRDNATTGKPSYGQVYSALNAVSGHFNNFGTKYPFPAKRKDRVYQEFESAELLLSRGR